MPCFLFTYHGHGTWMPDNPRGYVHRQHGLQPPDPHMADHYRHNQRADAVVFDDSQQQLLMDTARSTGRFIHATVRACAVESTHIHVLLSWNHDRDWKSVRAAVRSALSRALTEQFSKRDWFSDSPSRKRVRDHDHFDYLILVYLPKHRHCWVRDEDRMKAEDRDRLREVSVRSRRKRI